ncbi:MAG: 2-oxo-tetronate isomerase [Alphaproteobacteria bacterium]
MRNFAANLSMLFTEYDFLERFAAAHSHGFTHVEYLFPFDYAPELLQQKLAENQLSQELFNLYPGDWEGGERGIAIFPEHIAAFNQSLEQGLTYALALDCKKVHILSGIMAPDVHREIYEETLINNIRKAADLFIDYGITILLEPLNNRSVPGYFLSHQRQAVNLIKKINRKNVKLQFDLFHAQIMDGDISTLLTELKDYIGHIQVASIPSRNEPHLEEINFAYFCLLIEQIGYKGCIGLEYNPKSTTEAGLKQLKDYFNII